MKLAFFILTVLNLSCFAQNKTYRAFSKINYSSVDLYYFNCDKDSILIKHNLMRDGSLVDAAGNWAYTVSDIKYSLTHFEIENLLKVLKTYHLEVVTSDPVACYTPRMGIVFSKDKLPIAHIDICLECSKMMIEIFENKKIKFRESPFTIGDKTRRYFELLCLKYKLKGCDIR